MTTRRGFLRSSLFAAGGLLVGDAALEAFDRLTHQKVWTGHDFGSYETATSIMERTLVHQRAFNAHMDRVMNEAASMYYRMGQQWLTAYSVVV